MEQRQIEYQQINWTLSNIKAKASASNAELTGQDTVQSTIVQSCTQIVPDRLYREKKWLATQHLTQVKGCVRIQF